MKKIAITSAVDETVNKLNNAYVKAFYTDTTLPMIIPMYPIQSSEVISSVEMDKIYSAARIIAEQFDVLVLSGGNDINPVSFGFENVSAYNCRYKRDAIEISLVDEFMKVGKPIIGVCRGAQLLGLMSGLMYQQDIKNEDNKDEVHDGSSHDLRGRDEPTHLVELCGDFKDWAVANGMVAGDKIMVNSWHHQGISVKDNVKRMENIEVLAKTKHVIEAFRRTDIPMIGVQYHPEEYNDSITIKYILDKYINNVG